MKVISLPARLRLAIAGFALCVPIAALQVIVVSRAPWWKLPWRSVELWSLAVALICVPLGVWLAQGRRWALSLVAAFGGLWCLLSAWVSIRTIHPNLGFFTVFLMMYWSALISWLGYEMHRTFFDPRIRWYEGLPKPIPGLTCQFAPQAGASDDLLRVSRIDDAGVFVFSDRGVPLKILNASTELRLAFRGREVKCLGRPVRVLAEGAGAGFQFFDMNPDAQKNLGDFVEILRGEGHV